MKVVIIGKGLMLANLILGARDAGAEIVGVFRYENTCGNRLLRVFKDFINPEPELSLINEFKLSQIRLKSANSKAFKKLLISQNVDLLLVGTWKERIKPEIFKIPTIATVNVHPSLLPKYRGPNPYLQTILHGEDFSGVTLHLVDNNYDSGAILAQEKVKIEPNDTSKELREKSVRIARKLVANLITDLREKIIAPIPQNEKEATYYPNISGDERMLDFEFQTSEDISRTIRALHPFLPCYISYQEEFFVINPYSFKVLLDKNINFKAGDIISKNHEKRSLTIVCKDGKAIRFNGLKLYKKEILTSYFIEHKVEVTSL